MRLIAPLLFVAAIAAAPGPVTVTMKNMQFAPAKVSVSKGTTVIWKNGDVVAHTVTAVDGSWSSESIEPGKTYRHKFTKAGKYAIKCTPHPTMKNTVVVK
ncbi:MAG TPA: plastocyanin/azurin family copper-binding protein [Longimicrobiales bacterium]|nr:plastocyanin/azurin family copper-binding protein [Longimicrobiales bacterium]